MKVYTNERDLNKYLKYFSIKSINHKITLSQNNPLINNIICDNYYVNFNDFKLKDNQITIKYFLEFKILYSSLENNKTYTIKDIKVGYMEIFLTNKIDGENVKNIFLRNGFIINLKSLNPSIINFKKNCIYIFLNLLGYIDVLIIHSIVYKIKFSDFEENIYTSFYNGKDLTQRSFELNKSFGNFKFSSNDNYIFYLEQEFSANLIKKFSLETEDIIEVYKNKFLKQFEMFDDKNIILIIENISDSSLILFNIKTFMETIFYTFYDCKITFIKITSTLIILNLIKRNNNFLNLFDKKGNLIYEKEGIFDFYDISPCGNFLLLIEKNILKILFLNSLELYTLNTNSINEKLIKFKFLTSKQILLHVKSLNKENLIIFNLSNNKKEFLIETDFNIIDFSINHNDNVIYYTVKRQNICTIFTINQKNVTKEILSLNAKSLSLLVRP